MCLILFTVDYPSAYRMIVAANRDEFYDRPAAPLHFWPEAPDILAGRDIKAGGTWLGITRNGRFAAVTNYRDPASVRPDARSRGELVKNFLSGRESAETYLQEIASIQNVYNGFNLIAADGSGVYWLSNRQGEIHKLSTGVYGLSNHLLDTPWPKVRWGKERFSRWVQSPKPTIADAFSDVLSDQTYPPHSELPATGVEPLWERRLAPILITSRTYGTRSSSVLMWRKDGSIRLTERSYSPRSAVDGDPPVRGCAREYRFAPRAG